MPSPSLPTSLRRLNRLLAVSRSRERSRSKVRSRDYCDGKNEGTSIGLLALCSVIINQHFLKFRAMASGMSNAGFTIGGLIFPPLVQNLFDTYGVEGMFLVCGALMLNSTAGAFVQRSPPGPNAQAPKDKQEDVRKVDQESEKMLHSCNQETKLSSTQASDQSQDRESEVREELIAPNKVPQDVGRSNYEECKLTRADHYGDTSCRVLKQRELASLKKVHEINPAHTRSLKSFSFKSMTKHLRSFLILSKFYLIAFSLSQIHNNMTTFMTVIVDFALDRNTSKWHAVLLVSYYTIMDLVARVVSGWITDRGYLKRSTMMAVHLMIWGVSLYLIPVCRPYYCQALLSLVCGWCNGSTLILIAVFFVDLVGIDKLGACFGIATFLAGLLGLLRPPLIGYYRDRHGDYEGLFTLLAGLTSSMSLLWFWVMARERSKVQRRSKCSMAEPLPQVDITDSDSKEQRV